MKGIIYKYTNILNNKVYIGQTRQSMQQRAGTNGRGYDKQYRFGRAIRKYGWENFVGEVLEEVISDDIRDLQQKLNSLERFYIQKYDSHNNGYNQDLGGSSKIVSDATRKKLSECNKGKTHSEAVRNKISQKLKERKKSSTKN